MSQKIMSKVEAELKEVFNSELGAADPNTMPADELVDRVFSAVSKVMVINIMQASQLTYARAVKELREGTPTLAAPPKNIIIPGRG